MRLLLTQSYLLTVLLLHLVACRTKPVIGITDEHRIIDSLSLHVPGAKKFYESAADINSMLMTLQRNDIINKTNVSKIFKPDDFDIDLKNKLITIGITAFSYRWIRCYRQTDTLYLPYAFDFKTNWNNDVPGHLGFVPCSDEVETKLSNYFRRDNGNEGWGLGDGWILWYENYPLHDDTVLLRYNKK